jgi:hypothetical protein
MEISCSAGHSNPALLSLLLLLALELCDASLGILPRQALLSLASTLAAGS